MAKLPDVRMIDPPFIGVSEAFGPIMDCGSGANFLCARLEMFACSLVTQQVSPVSPSGDPARRCRILVCRVREKDSLRSCGGMPRIELPGEGRWHEI